MDELGLQDSLRHALIVGLRQGGAGRIVVYDMRFFGRNVDSDTLPGGLTVICGKPPCRGDWVGGLDESFAGMILLGLHSKAGTPDGLLRRNDAGLSSVCSAGFIR